MCPALAANPAEPIPAKPKPLFGPIVSRIMKTCLHLASFLGLLLSGVIAHAVPTIDSITGVTNGTYTVGNILNFTVNFSEPITVTGTDSALSLTLGSTAQSAAYVSKTSTNITYTYTVQAGDSAPIGVVVGVISLGASTITDSIGNPANLSRAGSTDFYRSTPISTGLAFPTGLRVDTATSNLVVADVNNNTIKIFSSNGTLLSSFNTGLNKPYGFTVDASGNYLVANTFANRLDKFATNGTFLNTITPSGTGASGFNRPFGVTVDGSGNILVSDFNNHRVAKLQPDGTFIQNVGSGLSRPTGTILDEFGNVYVTDSSNNRIQVFQSDGTFIRTIGAGFISSPYGLTWDAAGNIVVACNGTASVSVYTRSGLFQRSFAMTGPFPNAVGGVAVAASGDIYVASSEDREIQLWGRLFPITAFIDATPPSDISLSSASVGENQSIGTTVGTLSGTDADPGNTGTFTLVSGVGDTDNAKFSIVGSTLKTSVVLDYEAASSLSVRIRVTDAGGLFFEEAFTITVSDVNEPPVFAGYSFSVAKNTAATVHLAKILARTTDPEGNSRSVTAADTTSLQGGTIVVQSSSILYTPASDFTGVDSFQITFSDGTTPVAGQVDINVSTGAAGNGSALVSISVEGSDVLLRFAGIPGTNYLLQRSESLTEPVTWNTLSTIAADANGFVLYTDNSPPSPSYWRTLAAP